MNSRQSSGPRRRRGGRPRNSAGPRSGDNFRVNREPRKPVGFWDKLKAFFGFGAQPTSAPARHDKTESREPRERCEPRQSRAPRETRKPEAIEVTTPRLYVGNLSYDAVESDLFDLFSGVGTVTNVEIIANKHTQRSKGFGFVQMTSVAEAKRAVDELHDKDYMGRKLVVSGAKLPPDRVIGRDRDAEASSEEVSAEAEETTPPQA